MISLKQYLIEYGYREDDAAKIIKAYLKNDIAGAVETFKNMFFWADDETHDYSGELRDVILEWRESCRGKEIKKEKSKVILNYQLINAINELEI